MQLQPGSGQAFRNFPVLLIDVHLIHSLQNVVKIANAFLDDSMQTFRLLKGETRARQCPWNFLDKTLKSDRHVPSAGRSIQLPYAWSLNGQSSLAYYFMIAVFSMEPSTYLDSF